MTVFPNLGRQFGAVLGIGILLIAGSADAQIFAINSSPILTLPAEENYSDNGVYPDAGVAGDEFSFKINYLDINDDAPVYIWSCLWVMGRSEDCRDMTWEEDTDGVKPYETQASVSYSVEEAGEYMVYFWAYDGKGSKGSRRVRFPEQGGYALSITEGEDGHDSVLFIPGLEASRLYRRHALDEDKLWEPTNRNEDVKDLLMDENGESIYADIYTRDIIDEAHGFNVYKDFRGFMDGLVTNDTIAAWKAVPYDWRLPVDKIIERGVEDPAGNISYLSDLGSNQDPYMIKNLQELAENSDSGNVTIIAHSNGGLVAKALIDKLENEDSELLDRVSRIILVAVPQLGTPKALSGILHGDELQLAKGFILTKGTARELGENMPSSYTLLPSAGYFERVFDPIIEFTEESSLVYPFRFYYGEMVETRAEMTEFLRGEYGKRVEPEANDKDSPNVVKAGFLAAGQLAQDTQFDEWEAPEGIEIIQIAGWGLDTVRGIKYDNCEFCWGDRLSNLDRELLFTVDGDKTVVIPSAVAMEEARYFVNLQNYNVELFRARRNRDHSSILEVEPVQTLIEQLVFEEVAPLPDHITISMPPVETEEKRLRFKMHSPVDLHAYDKSDRSLHTGLVENTDPDSDLKLYEENIANSSYIELGETKYVLLDAGSTEEGYVLELDGTDLGWFTLEADVVENDEVVKTEIFQNLPVTDESYGELAIDSEGGLSDLALDVDGDGEFDVSLAANEKMTGDEALFLLRKIFEKADGLGKFKEQFVQMLNVADQHWQNGKSEQFLMALSQIEFRLGIFSGRQIDAEEGVRLIKIINFVIKKI